MRLRKVMFAVLMQPGFAKNAAFANNWQLRGSTFARNALSGTASVLCSKTQLLAHQPQAPARGSRVNIYDLTEDELGTILQETLGQPRYRAKQVNNWLYEKGARSFEHMQNLPKPLRASLNDHFTLGSLHMAYEQQSRDGTIKRAYRLQDGKLIEAVLMPYDDGRFTACISSQAGCAMGCTFCQTGQLGFSRQLTVAEIFEQALMFARDLQSKGQRLSNVVFMGEGEPLNNYKAVMQAAKRITAELGVGARHITISTVGVVPRIRQMTESEDTRQYTLAVSLHAATDRQRETTMPVNRRYPISDLMDACQYYVENTGRRISFEWALIAGQNDTPEDACHLAKLLIEAGLKGKCHVNAIPVNPTQGFKGRPSDARRIQQFLMILNNQFRISATVRMRRGIDIDGGCGQLRGKLEQGA